MTWWDTILAVVIGIPVLWGYCYTISHAIGYGFTIGQLRAIRLHFLKNAKPDQHETRTDKE